MTKNITLVRGDDTNFFDQVLLVVSFKTVLNLDGYKLRLTVENPTNIMKQYEIQQNAVQIDFSKIDSSTFSVGEHRANLKLIDTLGRVKTTYIFNITVQDEFEANIPKINEYEIELELDTDGINKYKNYKELSNKPSINGVELIDNKSLDELGIQPAGNYSTYEYVDGRFDTVNTEINNINIDIDNTNAILNNKANISYVEEELNLKADKIDLDTKANISDIPTRVSQLVNDEGYLTEHQDISNKADIDYVEELLDRKSDKSDTYTKVDVDTLIDNINEDIDLKQDKLIAGNNIFIDENNVISATGEDASVTSVNGMTGDVVIDIPSINGLATEQQLTDGLNTKQDKGDYITKTLYDQTNEAFQNALNGKQDAGDYVKKTDYATGSIGGVIKVSNTNGASINSGQLVASPATLYQYQNQRANNCFIAKGTLENIKDDYVKRGLTDNQVELTEEELAKVKTYLKFADNTDILTAIASIPQFKLSIVNELPLSGEKMTLYLVPKEGTDNDVYNEYIWIEQTASFEHLGTTAVDLTDYVKKTDYGTTSKAGVVKANSTYCFSINGNNGIVTCVSLKNLDAYKSRYNEMFISKGTLETVLTQYSKTVLTTEADYNALETKDSNTLYLIEE